ncbi:MAG: hypothetical protein EOP53_11765 [Sphingobacteriales bacterium]|nr:MAG: hypothetical protein EOP53_11765 [Sphingobacteriales bacterium]
MFRKWFSSSESFGTAGVYIISVSSLFKNSFYTSFVAALICFCSYACITAFRKAFNVAPYDIDVYDPKLLKDTIGFHIDEIKKFKSIINLGFIDSYRAINPDKQEYSWWDYRAGAFSRDKGMRIDHILTSPEASDLLIEADIDKNIRAKEKSSDHAPINITIKL